MTAKKWRCKKCGSTYQSPLPISAVTCQTCTNRAGSKTEKWMEPDE